ncbi:MULTISPECIES: ATP-binding cassette domain-containing protein [unclassified Prochlorococcus]|uniref:ATP-binding cassette domain-containing protein n=2 Tax=Prochlorococcus TaxID=1218 RepID=UPI00187CC9CA|nr:ATP-binding cassette domain-containing protein [Prochlorococcus sp. MIT 0602]
MQVKIYEKMVSNGKEPNHLGKGDSDSNSLNLDSNLNNVLQNELFIFYRDICIPTLRLFSNFIILLAVVFYCIYSSGIIFLPIFSSSLIYYFIYYSLKARNTINTSSNFIKSQSNNTGIIRYIFSNIQSFIYSNISTKLTTKSIREFNNQLNNYYILGKGVFSTIYQLELLFIFIVIIVLFWSKTLNYSLGVSSILVALIGLQKTFRTSQQIANSFTVFLNNSKTIDNIFELLFKSQFDNLKTNYYTSNQFIRFDKRKSIYTLEGRLSLDFLSKKKSLETRIYQSDFGFNFTSDQPVHISAPSGFGKTLILKRLLNSPVNVLNRELKGETRLVNQKNILLKDIAFYLPQSQQLPPLVISDFLPGLEKSHIDDLLNLFKFPRSIIENFRIKDYNKFLINSLSLSGGEVQRLWIIKAISEKPKILILDEPFSALNSEMIHDISKLLPTLLPPSTIVIITSHVKLSECYKVIKL